MHPIRTTVFAVALLAAAPTAAWADITGFLGFTTSPVNRTTAGFGVGMSLVIAGFEFEYSSTQEKEIDGAPSLRTGMFNGLLQTPTSGMQLYFTVGGGVYRERWRDVQETNFGTNIGGGVKVRLAGPVRARFDFRVFNLRGDALYPHPKRVYAGLNIAF
ncbi:MAG TPA: hypothetical protein VFO19_21795 [Vicinamibacterales bacterium]|jgi:hypothetical protein|nr:hypothetical protein [Vicinamibacterales bacterium]